MAERRRHERYDVSNLDLFVGQTDCTIVERRHVAFDLDIQTISGGGCGFYASADNDMSLKLGDRLTFRFQFRDNRCDPVAIKGDVVSIIPQNHSGRPECFYAVRFINVPQEAMGQVLNNLGGLLGEAKKEVG